jgi:hypothetical protein
MWAAGGVHGVEAALKFQGREQILFIIHLLTSSFHSLHETQTCEPKHAGLCFSQGK